MISDNRPSESRSVPATVPVENGAVGPVGPAGWRELPPRVDQEDAAGIPWARYIDAIKRQLWLVLLVSGLGSVAGLYLAGGVRPLYETEATIWINTPGASALSGEPVLRSDSWTGLVRSHAVGDPVVRELSLYLNRLPKDSAVFRGFTTKDSTFVSGSFRLEVDSTGRSYTLSRARAKTPFERGSVGDSIGRALGYVWAPSKSVLTPGRVVDFRVNTVSAAATALIGNLRPSLPPQSQFMKLYLSGGDAHRITATLNAWARQFVKTASELKKAGTLESRQLLAAQLAGAEKQLEEDEMSLRRFQERTITLPPENVAEVSGVGVTAFLKQQAEMDALQQSRVALEAIVAEANGGEMSPDKFYTVPNLLEQWPNLDAAVKELTGLNSEISVMERRLTAAHQSVATLHTARHTLAGQTLPAIAQSILSTLRSQESALSTRLATQRRELGAIPSRAIEAQRLSNRVTQSRTLYNSLQSKLDALKLIDVETQSDLTFFGEAQVPAFPTSNDGPRFFLMAVLASIAAGIGLALLRDRMDRRFRYPDQATVDLGLPIVGTVPNLRVNRRGRLHLAAMSQVVESFRTLRLAVRYRFQPGQPVVVCVSSAGAGEGKSLVSSNLAIAFARAGDQTLLIDGDVRRGTLHTTFDIERRPGLVDYLGGVGSAETIVQRTSRSNLSVVASGSRSRKAPEFLVSERMAALVSEMRTKFDVIVIDSPPFVAGMDAFALGASAGAMLVVLRAGTTDRKLTAAKLEILDRLPVSVLGAVINGISNGAGYEYYNYDSDYAIDDSMKEDADFPELGGEPVPPRLLGKE